MLHIRKTNSKGTGLGKTNTNLKNSLLEENVEYLENLKAQFQDIRNSRIDDIIIRSKLRWIKEMEK